MTRLTRKLMISILTVVLSISALGTTTFAWFTMTNVATVEEFSANIVSETGIEISLDGINWYNSLSSELIEAAIGEDFAFNHVTSADGMNFLTLGTSALVDASESDYISLVVYFRTANVESILWTEVSLTGTDVEWSPDVPFTASDGTNVTTASTVDVNAANAMRIAVYSPRDFAATALAPIVYEKAATSTALGSWNTFLDVKGDLSGVDGFGAPGAMDYYFEKTGELPFGAADPLVTTVDSVDTLPTGVSAIVMNFESTTDGVITYDEFDDFDVNYGTALGGYLVINIWFEGYDAEAYNSLLAQQIAASFTFEGYEIPTP